MPLRNTPITRSAKGEKCTVNIPGYCNEDPEKTVLAHFPNGTGGSNKLNGDLCAGYACSDCHDIIDGRRLVELRPGDKEFFMRRSQCRTLERLVENGLVTVVQ